MANELDPKTVSTSYYLYYCEADELCIPKDIQLMFIKMRLRRVDVTIGSILRVNYRERDNTRLRACIKTRNWCHKMIKEIEE